MIRDKIVVEHAGLMDWPSIASMRDRYFATFKREVQERPKASWVVCRRRDVVIGCYSYQHFAEYSQTWVLDFYRTPGHDGTRAVAAMYRNIIDQLACVHDVVFTIDPLNGAQEVAVRKHGAEEIGRMFRLEKGHR